MNILYKRHDVITLIVYFKFLSWIEPKIYLLDLNLTVVQNLFSCESSVREIRKNCSVYHYSPFIQASVSAP